MGRRETQPFWEQELLSYAGGVHRLSLPASNAELLQVEGRLGHGLHPDHRAFLARFNGASFFHDTYRLFDTAMLVDEQIGEEGGHALSLDRSGRVIRHEVGADEQLIVGSRLRRWLDAIFAREALLYDLDGEFRDAFEANGELRYDLMLRREERAVTRDPDAPAAHFELGRLLLQHARTEAAAKAFSRALQLDDSFAWAHFELGRACRLLHRAEPAVSAFQRAAALRPDNAAVFLAWAARTATEAKLTRLAHSIVAHIRLLDPTFAERHRSLARELLAAGDPNASEMLALAVAVDGKGKGA